MISLKKTLENADVVFRGMNLSKPNLKATIKLEYAIKRDGKEAVLRDVEFNNEMKFNYQEIKAIYECLKQMNKNKEEQEWIESLPYFRLLIK